MRADANVSSVVLRPTVDQSLRAVLEADCVIIVKSVWLARAIVAGDVSGLAASGFANGSFQFVAGTLGLRACIPTWFCRAQAPGCTAISSSVGAMCRQGGKSMHVSPVLCNQHLDIHNVMVLVCKHCASKWALAGEHAKGALMIADQPVTTLQQFDEVQHLLRHC